jgi:hypothetical protein
VSDVAGNVMSTAQERAEPAVHQAKDRVRSEVDRRSTQAGEQLGSLAQAMRRAGDDLRSDGNEPHGKVAEAAAERMDQVGSYLRRADADTLLSDVEDLARRQPMVVIAGGLMLGLAAARFLKASSDRRYDAYRARTPQPYRTPTSEPYRSPTSEPYRASTYDYDPYGARTPGV